MPREKSTNPYAILQQPEPPCTGCANIELCTNKLLACRDFLEYQNPNRKLETFRGDLPADHRHYRERMPTAKMFGKIFSGCES
jgi:hypothetical protein